MRIVDMIFHWAKAKPLQPAIIQPDSIFTFAKLAQAIEAAASRIAQKNLDQNKPVAVLIEDPVRHLTVCYALMHLGFTIAPVNRALLRNLPGLGIDTLIHSNADTIISEGNNIRFDDSWIQSERLAADTVRSGQKPDRKNGNLIFLTSGTTSTPKIITHPVDAFFERLYHSNKMLEGHYGRTLVIPGVDGLYGFYPAWSILSSGRTVCFGPEGEPMLLMIGTYSIDYIIASPQQALGLVAIAEKNGGYKLDSVKAVRMGGAMITKELVRRIQSVFCPTVIITYGSTEAATMAFGHYDMISRVPNAVGFVAPWIDLEIVDDNGNVLPAGVEGRVRARTPVLTARIAMDPQAALDDTRDGWWYSGDFGCLTEDGILRILGRGDDILNRGGSKIAAVYLDEALCTCPGIADAGVCGVWGEGGILQIWAGIVTTADFNFDVFMRTLETNAELRNKLESNLDQVIIVENIPRARGGKIQRGELRELLLKMAENPSTQT